jgi:3-dehydroquinate synthase
MLDNGFSRKDCVVAVGGGVVGDLSGLAASMYMRGVDFYNIPTTLLSQIDSSIGGKTAINFGGVKNVVGAFYQPKRVLIDPELLNTLPPRQISNGLAEAIKMALTSDADLFALFEQEDIEANLEEIICVLASLGEALDDAQHQPQIALYKFVPGSFVSRVHQGKERQHPRLGQHRKP